MNKAISCFKSSSDDWYGNFKIDDARHIGEHFVHVSFVELMPEDDKRMYRVHVWGNDDCGMEFDTNFEWSAKNIYTHICLMKDVTKAALTELGFVRA